MFIGDLFNKKTIAEESPTLSRPQAVPVKQTPPPLNVPQGWEAKTQADGSTRISKQGSMSSAEYKQNMADYKAKNWTPEKIADYSQRMASGQGYTDAERSANYQQQQKSFGQYADTPLDEAEPTVNQPRTTMSDERKAQLRKDIDAVDYNKEQQPPAATSPERKAGIRQSVSDYNKEKVKEQDLKRSPYPPEKDFPNWYDMRDRKFEVHQNDGTIDFIQPGTDEWNEIYDREFPDTPRPDNLRDVYSDGNPVAEGKADPAGSWVVYDGSKVKRFKSHDGAKAYAAKNGGKVASSEFYADKIQKQSVAEGGKSYLDSEPYTPPKDAQGKSYLDSKPYSPPKDAQGKSYLDPAPYNPPKDAQGKSYLDFDPMKSQMDPSGKSYFDTGVDEGFDDLDRFMKDKYGPKPSGGSGIKHGTYGQPGRQRGRKKGELSGAFHQGGGSDVPHNVDFDRSHSERSAGRRMPRFSDDYDSVKRSEVDEGSVQDKLHKRHQELRKKRGAPDPEYYQELKKTFDLPDDERQARTAELKQKYKITNEDRERYIEALGRAGYEIVNERRMTCPECGGAAYEDRMLAEKQDACYHKVKSRYKVWPSAYASGALVRCRKKGAANWGNKSKK